jgi:hypothetical protein
MVRKLRNLKVMVFKGFWNVEPVWRLCTSGFRLFAQGLSLKISAEIWPKARALRGFKILSFIKLVT